jgi:hypothetical protein
MKAKAVSVIGWYGVAAILGAYALVSFNVVEAKSFTYQLLNLSGAVAIIIEALTKKDYQPAALNGVIAIIAVLAIARIILS